MMELPSDKTQELPRIEEVGLSQSQWAPDRRKGLKKLSTQNRGQVLDRVTISVGIAAFPEHGRSRTGVSTSQRPREAIA
jgi:hypothetical protein